MAVLPSQAVLYQRSPQLFSLAGFLCSPWTGGESAGLREREEAVTEEATPPKKPPVPLEEGPAEPSSRVEEGSAEPPASSAREEEGSPESSGPSTLEEESASSPCCMFWRLPFRLRILSFNQKGMSVGEDSVRG